MNGAVQPALFLIALLSSGCAQWKEPEKATGLAVPAPPAEAAIVDIAFIPLPISEDAVDWRMWNVADEMCIDKPLRQQLALNGLRVGTFSGNIPEIIRTQLGREYEDHTLNLLEQANLLSDLEQGGRRVHCHPEKKYELPVRNQMQGTISLLLREGDSLIGHRITDPLFLFSMEVAEGRDGQSLLRLTPEIQHGQTRQSWVSHEQALRLESKRSVEKLEHLAIEIPMMTSTVALISPTVAPIGLGEKMFSGQRVDGKREVTAVAIRMSREPSR